jgi:regulator of RNase E activity RraA
VSPEVLDALRRYDSCTLSNAIETFDVRPRDAGFTGHDLHCMFTELGPVVGFAATCTVRTRATGPGIEQSDLWQHVISLPGPRILVAQDLDQPPCAGAQWGEVQATTFKALGCAAIVTDGVVRDLTEVRAMGLQMYAAGTNPSHAYARFVGAGDEVTVAGLTVRPGDLLHGDQHGILLIPAEIATELPAAADAIIAREQKLIGWIRSDDFSVERLAEMRAVKH